MPFDVIAGNNSNSSRPSARFLQLAGPDVAGPPYPLLFRPPRDALDQKPTFERSISNVTPGLHRRFLRPRASCVFAACQPSNPCHGTKEERSFERKHIETAARLTARQSPRTLLTGNRTLTLNGAGAPNLFLEQHHAVEQRFRRRRAARHVDVDGHDAGAAAHHRV